MFKFIFKLIRILIVMILLVVVAAGLAVATGYPLGLYLEPRLEGILTRIFGMEVRIDGLRADPFTGKVHVSRIRFINQKEYSEGPHLDTQMDFRIDFLKLRDKHVAIRKLILKKPYYLIETIPFENEGNRSNVRTWVQHIKDWKKERQEKKEESQKIFLYQQSL